MKRRFKKMLTGVAVLLLCLAAAAYVIFSHPRFGKQPGGDRLAALERSPNYSGGKFRNTVPTLQLAEGNTFLSIMWDSLTAKKERVVPEGPLPTVKTDLTALDPEEDVLVWLGHSSFFIQLDGKKILLDPVLSPSAAPFSFLNKAFPGTTIYTAEDMPEIDYLLISHDHWDHLDYPTVTALEPKVKNVVCGLGVGSHFEYWGYAEEKIHEADWFTRLPFEDGLIVHVLPARHYSGRLLNRYKTLWAGFALETPARRVFFSGDSGYGPHFAEIGKLFDGFDLVILDSGQYNERWAYIHMTPEEAAQAAEDLGAAALFPAHIGKFTIAMHSWDEPFERILKTSGSRPYRLLTPMIGAPASLAPGQQPSAHWWEGLK